ncbi:hypothetical protein IFM53868_09623 [Aspergillus udagawae]|uniref:Uncharacterized protein n=1 Tax=Aspergillus udagawae TaxID=91492 RepID=A0ABQ1BBY4_9EURO|nr:hypothetical protein IFM53868_09623 [Aspergillus udagawae]
MLLQFSKLSNNFLDMTRMYTRHIRLRLLDTSAPTSERRSTDSLPISQRHNAIFKSELNKAIRWLAAMLPLYDNLESFFLGNYLEPKSWTIISPETFETILASLAVYPLDYVQIDMPGAPRENRQLLGHSMISDTHGCDIIRRNFPNTRVFHLRMRTVCPTVLDFYRKRPRLEIFKMALQLEPVKPPGIDLDVSVVSCRHGELLGRELVAALEPAAISLFSSGQTPYIRSLEFTLPVFRNGKERSQPETQTCSITTNVASQ